MLGLLKSRRKDVGIGVLDTILAAEANGRTRVVLNLDAIVPYETRVEGNSIVVTLGQPSQRQRVSGGTARLASFDGVLPPSRAGLPEIDSQMPSISVAPTAVPAD